MVGTTYAIDGTAERHYFAYTTNLKDMFFEGARIERKIDSPAFGRYKEKAEVFLHDSYRGIFHKESDGTEVKFEQKTASGDELSDADKTEIENDMRWLIPERDSIRYKYDEKTGVFIFDFPQFKLGGNKELTSNNEAAFSWIPMLTYADGNWKMVSRDVYVTATFTTDVSSILGKVIENDELQFYRGPHNPIYIDRSDIEIIIHQDAWYPLSDANKIEAAISYSTETLDGHIIGRSIRECTSFDNYKKYANNTAEELNRLIDEFIKGYDVIQEAVDATLPMLELGSKLLDRIHRIHGTDYDDLKSYLMKINWSMESDSDYYTTKYQFANTINKDSNETPHIFNKRERYQGHLSRRRSYKLVNEEEVDI